MKDWTVRYLVAQAVIIGVAAILGAIAVVRHVRFMDESSALLARTARIVAAENGGAR